MDCQRLIRLIVAAQAATLLTACVTRPEPLYYWGDFPAQQYDYFLGEKGPEAGIQALEKTREEAKAQNKALPPGFEAHLGLLYGQTGRTDLLEQHLEAEKKLFPESAAYVDFLLKKKQQEIQAKQEQPEKNAAAPAATTAATATPANSAAPASATTPAIPLTPAKPQKP